MPRLCVLAGRRFGRLGIREVVALVAIATAPLSDALAAQPNSHYEAEIAERLTALNLPAYTADLPSQKATRAREAIKRGDYPTARNIIAGVLAGSRLQSWRFYPFSDFMARVPDVRDPEFETRLNEWVAERDDPIALLVRAQYFHDAGWFTRGRQFAFKVQKEHLAEFADDMNKALDDIDASVHFDSSNPYSFFLKLRILHGFGLSAAIKSEFNKAISKFPGYYPLYTVMLSTLDPRWGGSAGAMHDFVDEYAGKAPENSTLKMLHLALYTELLEAASVACQDSRPTSDQLARCIQGAMAKFVTPALELGVQAALRLYGDTDAHQFRLALGDLLFRLLGVSGGDAYSGPVLQLAATAMHGDTKLEPNDSAYNDYIIDLVVAKSWRQKGFYENAMAKYQQALRDLRHATFPDEAENKIALAGVYEMLADLSQTQRQYVDSIVYAKAAIALGDVLWGQHYVCYGYYMLKEYDAALPPCTDTIRLTGNLKALFWRGKAYEALGRRDEAERDFTDVAGSEGEFRSSAAIALSMLYFNRRDNQAALDVLTRYTYLYDENITRKSDIAVAYNNRCYAYMELGDLKKALDDCTASLHYGSLPDAFRKQQELVSRLKAPGEGARPAEN